MLRTDRKQKASVIKVASWPVRTGERPFLDDTDGASLHHQLWEQICGQPVPQKRVIALTQSGIGQQSINKDVEP